MQRMFTGPKPFCVAGEFNSLGSAQDAVVRVRRRRPAASLSPSRSPFQAYPAGGEVLAARRTAAWGYRGCCAGQLDARVRELPGGQVCGAVPRHGRGVGMSAVEATGGLPEGEAVPGAGQGVVALYREPYGPVRSCGAAALQGVALEEFGPVSEPVPYRGRRGIITYWPVATREQTVVCGSLRQWLLAVELDFDPAWAAFSAGPIELRWRAGGRLRRWRPDFLARTADGVREVLVLKPAR